MQKSFRYPGNFKNITAKQAKLQIFQLNSSPQQQFRKRSVLQNRFRNITHNFEAEEEEDKVEDFQCQKKYKITTLQLQNQKSRNRNGSITPVLVG